MDPKHLTAVIVSAILGVILLVTVVAPIVSDGQTTTGDPVTLTNESTEYLSLSEGDCSITHNDGVTTINGNTITLTAADKLLFATDYVIVYFNGTNLYGSYLNQGSGIRNIESVDLTVANGLLNGSIDYADNISQSITDQPVNFSFYYDPNGEYSLFEPAQVTPYVASIKDLYMVGTYYTGDNDTYYWYYNGVAGGISQDYTYSVTATLTPANGTTDLYTASDILMHVNGATEESFTPYNMIVQKEITGHATSGSLYSMLGVIPIVVAIGIVLGVVSMAIVNRYD